MYIESIQNETLVTGAILRRKPLCANESDYPKIISHYFMSCEHKNDIGWIIIFFNIQLNPKKIILLNDIG